MRAVSNGIRGGSPTGGGKRGARWRSGQRRRWRLMRGCGWRLAGLPPPSASPSCSAVVCVDPGASSTLLGDGVISLEVQRDRVAARLLPCGGAGRSRRSRQRFRRNTHRRRLGPVSASPARGRSRRRLDNIDNARKDEEPRVLALELFLATMWQPAPERRPGKRQDEWSGTSDVPCGQAGAQDCNNKQCHPLRTDAAYSWNAQLDWPFCRIRSRLHIILIMSTGWNSSDAWSQDNAVVSCDRLWPIRVENPFPQGGKTRLRLERPAAQLHLHSSGAASRLAALLLPQILPGILGRRALPSGRIATLGATMDLHHGPLTSGKRAVGTPIPTARSQACDAFFVQRRRPAPKVFATNRPEPTKDRSRQPSASSPAAVGRPA